MTRYTCPHLIARSGVCNDPALIEEPVTWCAARGDCATKNDARPRHVANLTRIAERGDRNTYAEYLASVRSADGAASAEQLKAAFVAAWGTK